MVIAMDGYCGRQDACRAAEACVVERHGGPRCGDVQSEPVSQSVSKRRSDDVNSVDIMPRVRVSSGSAGTRAVKRFETSPPFRYPGGKRRLAPRVGEWLADLEHAPPEVYVEPFVGAGAVLCELLGRGDNAIGTYIAGDANPDLLAAWQVLSGGDREAFESMLAELDGQPATRRAYETIRAVDVAAAEHAGLPAWFRAARFLYLQALSFNGLWRVNRSGRHNVPWGRKAGATVDGGRLTRLFEQLEALDEPLQLCPTWQDAIGVLSVTEGAALVFVDPPYTGGFDAYTAEGFGLEDQRQLEAALRLLLSVRAVPTRVVVTLPDVEWVQDLYSWHGWTRQPIKARRSIAANGDREAADELVIYGCGGYTTEGSLELLEAGSCS